MQNDLDVRKARGRNNPDRNNHNVRKGCNSNRKELNSRNGWNNQGSSGQSKVDLPGVQKAAIVLAVEEKALPGQAEEEVK